MLADVFESEEDPPVIPFAGREGPAYIPAVPERFPETRVIAQDWLASAEELLASLGESQDDLVENEDDKEFLKEFTAGIGPTVVTEIVEDHIAEQMQTIEERMDEDTLARLREFASESPKKTKRAGPCKVLDLKLDPDTNPKSEVNIVREWRRKAQLKSLALVHDWNGTIFCRTHVPMNALKNPHARLHRNLDREAVKADSRDNAARSLVTCPVVVYTATFYHAVRGMKACEVDILGSQTLADLRDAFTCAEDAMLHPGCKGACFYIDGIFYSDTRDPAAPDYGKWISDYMEKHCSRQTLSRPMQDVNLSTMSIVVNQRCAFLHQGDCEHRVVFSALRVFDPERDAPHRSSYPLRVFEPGLKVTLCEICAVCAANRLIFNSCLLPKNPMKLCGGCVSAFLCEGGEGREVDNDDFVELEFKDAPPSGPV